MANGYTEVRYNDVVLRDCLTTAFEQKPVFSPDGQTMLYHKFTVSVQGWFLSGEGESSTVEIEQTPRSPYVTAGNRYASLADNIAKERCKFEMRVGVGGPAPTRILYAEPPPATAGILNSSSTLFEYYDRNGGPRVSSLNIEEITANETFKVNVTFEICIRPYDCPNGGVSASEWVRRAQRAYGVLSNRWTCVDMTDENRFTTRTYSGQLTLSAPAINPHDFRYLCLPPLHEGFMRKHMEFAAQEDGLKLRYSIRDEQVTVTPVGTGQQSGDSTYMRVSQKEVIGEMSNQVMTHFSIILRGTPFTSRKTLIRIAAVYADAKLALFQLVKPLDDPDQKKAVRVRSYVMHEEFDSAKINQVTLSIVLERHPDAETGVRGMLSQVTQNFGNEVTGGDLAFSTDRPELEEFLADYDHRRSYGNRQSTVAGGLGGPVTTEEKPLAVGVTGITAALAVHLQNECTMDFSICAGVTGEFDGTRATQIKDSRGACSTPTIAFVRRRNIPDLANENLSAADRENAYQAYSIESEYTDDQLLAAMPIARSVDPHYSPGSTSTPFVPVNPATAQTAFIRLGPPQNKRVVRVSATRWGKVPQLPPPHTQFTDADGVQYALMSKRTLPVSPVLTGNQDMRLFTVEAEYTYAMSHDPKTLKPGVPEYESGVRGGLAQFVIPVSELNSGRPIEYTA